MPKGSCLCGAVQYEVRGEFLGPSLCHCRQCRKQSGPVRASAYVPDAALKWYASSTVAKRGFCGTCGAFLFWKMTAEDTTSFSHGSLDGSTGASLEKHIFMADKGDYDVIADDLPKEG